MLAWTTLHGLVSTELAGHLEPMGIDPGLLFHAEINEMLSVTKRPK